MLQSTQFTLIIWKIFALRNASVILGVINFGCLEPLGGRREGKGKQKQQNNKKPLYLALLLSWKIILLLSKENAAQISSD